MICAKESPASWRLFTDIDTSFVPIGSIINDGGIAACLEYYRKLGDAFYQALVSMIVFDAVIVNEDRHFGNFGLMRDNRSGRFVSPAPIFDNGMSLLAQAMKADFTESLEEYVRKSEMADHTSWSDWSEGTYNPRIITKIQNGVNRLISREFAPENRGPAPKEKSGLGKFLGDMILPPEGFGRLAESEKDKKSPSAGAANKGRRFRVENDRIRYFAESMMVPVIIDSGTKNKLSKVSFEIQVDSEVKRMSIGEWEQKMGLQTPFAIKNCRIDIETVEGKKAGVYDTLPENEMKKEMQGLIFRKMYTEKGSCYGMTISSETSRAFKMKLSLTVMVTRRDVKSVFIFEGED